MSFYRPAKLADSAKRIAISSNGRKGQEASLTIEIKLIIAYIMKTATRGKLSNNRAGLVIVCCIWTSFLKTIYTQWVMSLFFKRSLQQNICFNSFWRETVSVLLLHYCLTLLYNYCIHMDPCLIVMHWNASIRFRMRTVYKWWTTHFFHSINLIDRTIWLIEKNCNDQDINWRETNFHFFTNLTRQVCV